MANLKRVNVKQILNTPHLRKEIMIRVIQFIQAVEGITTGYEQAEIAYDNVQKENKTC